MSSRRFLVLELVVPVILLGLVAIVAAGSSERPPEGGAAVQPATPAAPEPSLDPAGPASPGHGIDATMPPPAAPERSKLPPMMQEILAAWDAHTVVVEAIETRLSMATGHAQVLALERQIERERERVEIDILGIQARYARQEGRLEQALEIEAAIAVMTAPRPRGVPVERHTPEDGSR